MIRNILTEYFFFQLPRPLFCNPDDSTEYLYWMCEEILSYCRNKQLTPPQAIKYIFILYLTEQPSFPYFPNKYWYKVTVLSIHVLINNLTNRHKHKVNSSRVMFGVQQVQSALRKVCINKPRSGVFTGRRSWRKTKEKWEQSEAKVKTLKILYRIPHSFTCHRWW